MSKTITAGMAIRRMIRRFLLEQDINFIEEKGWINSVFYLKCSDEKYRWVVKILDDWDKSFENKDK